MLRGIMWVMAIAIVCMTMLSYINTAHVAALKGLPSDQEFFQKLMSSQ